MSKKKLNWWIIAAVVILGVPVGFVVMGIIDKSKSQELVDEPALVDDFAEIPDTIVAKESVIYEFDGGEQELAEVETLPEAAPEPKMEKTVTEPVALTPEQKEERARKEAERKALAQQKAEEAAKRKEEARQKVEEERARKEAERKALAQQKAEEAAKRKEEARQKVEEERARKEAERKALAQQKAENERLKAEERRKAEEDRIVEEARKKQQAYDQLLSEVSGVIASGKSSSKVPEGCVVVVNGKHTTNYQDFRNGVKLGSYSGIKVTKIEGDGTVSKIYVTAKVKSAED